MGMDWTPPTVLIKMHNWICSSYTQYIWILTKENSIFEIGSSWKFLSIPDSFWLMAQVIGVAGPGGAHWICWSLKRTVLRRHTALPLNPGFTIYKLHDSRQTSNLSLRVSKKIPSDGYNQALWMQSKYTVFIECSLWADTWLSAPGGMRSRRHSWQYIWGHEIQRIKRSFIINKKYKVLKWSHTII